MAKSNIRITKRVVGDLKAADKERFVWDNELGTHINSPLGADPARGERPAR